MEDEEPSFEDELMMMEEMLGEQVCEGVDPDGDQQEMRWSRPSKALDPSQPLGWSLFFFAFVLVFCNFFPRTFFFFPSFFQICNGWTST